mmetsp:Transcript_52503/g.154971  ORF Transcript_52503/g.154971 Transcript_52503/m.154971 type:complete len:213 (-) Transcript_52503:2452-3090(-)
MSHVSVRHRNAANGSASPSASLTENMGGSSLLPSRTRSREPSSRSWWGCERSSSAGGDAADGEGGGARVSRSRTWAAMAPGVGCSKTSDGDSGTPLSSSSLLDSSAAASESMPASTSGELALSPSPPRLLASLSTSAATCACRCSCVPRAPTALASSDGAPPPSRHSHNDCGTSCVPPAARVGRERSGGSSGCPDRRCGASSRSTCTTSSNG